MSGFLLDTNVLSETTRPQPNKGVQAFLADLPEAFISVLSIHEIAYGLERLPQGPRRTNLTDAMENLLGTFAATVLAIHAPEARAAGVLRAAAKQEGRIVDTADGLLAGTALVHGLTIVTRNVKDFAGLGVLLRNPWSEGA